MCQARWKGSVRSGPGSRKSYNGFIWRLKVQLISGFEVVPEMLVVDYQQPETPAPLLSLCEDKSKDSSKTGNKTEMME